MYEISAKHLAFIKASMQKTFEAQQEAFSSLDFNPYFDEGDVTNASLVMERERYERECKERISYPIDYGVCETEERAEEISSGAALSDEEEKSINEDIFDEDDTFMVVTELSDGTDSVFAVNVQQMWGQGGLHVIDFIGFFAKYEEAQQASEAADYVTFDES
jgi:hypothetical protein